MTNYFSLNEAMGGNNSDDIISALKKVRPAPDKIRSIRKEYSNNFTYTLNFDTDTTSASTIVMEDGVIDDDSQQTNIATVQYYLNSNSVTIPFSVQQGDKIDVVILASSSGTSQIILESMEHDEVYQRKYSDYSPKNVEGLKCWLTPEEGITLNYQNIGIIDCTQGSKTITSNSSLFSNDDVGKHVRITFNGEEYFRVVESYNSATEVEVDYYMPFTDTGLTLDIGYVAQWDDISGNGVSFIQTTADKQPVLKDNMQNGLPSVFFEIPDYMTANKHIAYERTVYAVLQSTETATSSYSRLFFGDYLAGGTWFAEWANPTPQVLYGLNNNYKGSQGLINTSSPITTVRNGFHQVALRLSPEKGWLRVDESYILASSNNTGSIAPQTLFSIGSRGDGAAGCLGYITELLIYDRYHSDEEVLIIEKYLKDKYNL